MSTLYISDLDATLLNSGAQLTAFTRDTLNKLSQKGLMFSYATARSVRTASKVTEGINFNIPVIVYTGTFIADNRTHQLIDSCFMDEKEVSAVVSAAQKFSLYPIVYSYVDGEEKFMYDPVIYSRNVRDFASTREGDNRRTEVSGGFGNALVGDIFYFTFMEPYHELLPVYEELKCKCNCLFQPDNYTDNWFLEVMPRGASKAKAALRLKEITGAQKLVVFGDGYNDLELFSVADEAYAVSNAEEAVKAAATAVIKSCDEDAVARWLMDNSDTK